MWLTRHPAWHEGAEWPEEVLSVYHVSSAAVVLFDALVRADLDERAWQPLDALVEAAGLPVVALLTAPWHSRSVREVVVRYSAAVWAHKGAWPRLPDLPWAEDLPEGIDVFTPGGLPSDPQVAFFIRAHRALIVGEFFMSTADGLVVCPSPALQDRAAFDRSLRTLLDLDVEYVLVGHGDPVLRDGGQHIAQAIVAAS
jgi:glyoxylase-like metal-dependent hydrolase (beta-lactamase superfamily II)